MKVSLDTSVFSALLDSREPSRQALTQAFWNSKDQYQMVTGEVAQQEIGDNFDLDLRSQMLSLLFGFEVYAITTEARTIHHNLLQTGPFSARTADDAMHIAIAAANHDDVLLSWNFKHLVNQRRRMLVNNILVSIGYNESRSFHRRNYDVEQFK